MSQLLLSALAVVCPNCDGHNPPRAAACGLCGTSLVEAPPARPAAKQAAPTRPPAVPPSPTNRPVAVTAFPRPGEPPAVTPRPPEAVPPGLRPSSRTPPPTPLAGLKVAAGPAPSGANPPAATRPTAPGGLTPKASPGAPAARPPPAASRFGLAVIAGTARGQRYKLPVSGCAIGRTRGAILFADDAFVSPQHATFLIKDGGLFVRDEASASGVYVTIPGAELVAPRTLFSAGQRLFRFNGRIDVPTAVPGRPTVYGAPVPLGQALYGVEEMLLGGRGGRLVVTAAQLLTIGQQHCDLSYPGDEQLAGRHCELSPSPTGAILRDLSGGLGTYVRIAPQVERPLRPGDRVRVGQHIIQVEALA
ncbi:FHA domain-containing protein [Myxococcaceae bacterium GXIMD 01537]